MATSHTDGDFDRLSWHDCHIWGIELRAGETEEGDWTSDLALEIDYILEWLCGVQTEVQFRVAPATLVFHGVTDLRIGIDWGRSGFQCSLHELSMDGIQREVILEQKVFLDRPYYRWTIRLNWPSNGEIAFGAAGFTQTLRAEPVLIDTQSLSLRERARLIGR